MLLVPQDGGGCWEPGQGTHRDPEVPLEGQGRALDFLPFPQGDGSEAGLMDRVQTQLGLGQTDTWITGAEGKGLALLVSEWGL